MHAQFVRDYPLQRFPYRYITALIRPDYYKKGLVYGVTHGGKSVRRIRLVRPVFVAARTFLDLPHADFRVQRDVFSYQYPLYWFDAKKLLSLVNRLRRAVRKPALRKLEPQLFSAASLLKSSALRQWHCVS